MVLLEELKKFSEGFLFKTFVEDTKDVFDDMSFGVLDFCPKDVGEGLERERLIGECIGVRKIAGWFTSLEDELIRQSNENE